MTLNFDVCIDFDCNPDYCEKSTGRRCKTQGDSNCIFAGEHWHMQGYYDAMNKVKEEIQKNPLATRLSLLKELKL